MPILENMINFPSHKNNAVKSKQFNTLQKKLVFFEICLQDICPVNGLKTFYVDIKAIEFIKKQTTF